MRTLASIQKIEELSAIPGADKIEVARILGWNVVVQKGVFRPGDKCIYCEIDSMLPDKPEYEFLRNRCWHDRLGGYRIKTSKLRGVISQGIAFPLNGVEGEIGDDLTEKLGIWKYDPPAVHGQGGVLLGCTRGAFPSFIPKTDETRIQSIPDVLERHRGVVVCATEKYDGTSMTCFLDSEDNELHVCSRNLDVYPPDHEHGKPSVYWEVAQKLQIESILHNMGGEFAIQGEIIGPGIQKNKYGLPTTDLKIFNLFDTKKGAYVGWYDAMSQLVDGNLPQRNLAATVVDPFPLEHSVEDILNLAKGNSELADTPREGIVIRPVVETRDLKLGRLSFKAINNDFLLKHGE